MDYSLYYRKELDLNAFRDWDKWDLFLSAYNKSDRVTGAFEKVNAHRKLWLSYPEYELLQSELPSEHEVLHIEGESETDQLMSLTQQVDLTAHLGDRICIDMTGFMRPQLLFILFYLKKMNFKEVIFLYSEPITYGKREQTTFAKGSVYKIEPVSGFSGSPRIHNNRDLLIIMAGFDKDLISHTAQHHENSDIVELFGFPSLRPDMYQDNRLRTSQAAYTYQDSILGEPLFAPAFDPFETARVVSEYLERNHCFENYHHVYITPLSTKPQTLGLGIAFLNELAGSNVSVIYPYTRNYEKETSTGLARLWQYQVEF